MTSRTSSHPDAAVAISEEPALTALVKETGASALSDPHLLLFGIL
jgi:hypothetical protein